MWDGRDTSNNISDKNIGGDGCVLIATGGFRTINREDIISRILFRNRYKNFLICFDESKNDNTSEAEERAEEQLV